jgi:hypothetical protein
MGAGKVFPIVSVINGEVVAGHTCDDQVAKVVTVINNFAKRDVVAVGAGSYDWDGKAVFKVGEVPVSVNPAYAKSKDPHGWALAGIVALATAPKARKRATGGNASAESKGSAGKVPTRRAPLTAKPTGADKVAAGKSAAGKRSTRAKVSASS